MQTTETLLGLLRERGKRDLPLKRVYRQLYNINLYLTAYGRIYRNAGAMTPGVTEETVDAMSVEKIRDIIAAVRQERYQWHAARRTYVPKKNGKKRPLGMPYLCSSRRVRDSAVANGVDQKPQSTLFILLYHVLLRLSSSTMVPMLLGWLAKLCDAFWGKGNPAWSMRSCLHIF